MAASLAEIREWAHAAKAEGAAYLIVKVDDWDHVDYPVRVFPADDFDKRAEGDRIMEVYDLGGDVPAQLSEHRAFHPPATSRCAGRRA